MRERDGSWRVRQYSGDTNRVRALDRKTLDWISESQDRGAGEIVLNCMDNDGVRTGYDIEQLARAREVCSVPLIASGGAGCADHFRDVFRQADVDGALAASVFHSGALSVRALKSELAAQNIAVRQ
jgi:cyclase